MSPRKKKAAVEEAPTETSDPQDVAIESAVGQRQTAQEFEDQKQRDLEAARKVHNERTGGGPIADGEVVAARQARNERLSGN